MYLFPSGQWNLGIRGGVDKEFLETLVERLLKSVCDYDGERGTENDRKRSVEGRLPVSLALVSLFHLHISIYDEHNCAM
jgi:hypothetical protein